MRILILGALLYMGYRLIVPRKEIPSAEQDNNQLEDDAYTDYEEIE